MNFYKLIILFISFTSIATTQFTEVTVNIDYSNINQKEMFMFENFDNELRSYFINNYFFDDPSADEALDMTLKIHCIIESINQKGGETIVSAHILFSNQADQHHSSKSFDFRYNKSEALYKSEMFHPLTSLLDFYAYLQIAYELDTFEYLGGNKYFIKAQNIASDAKNSMYSRNWQVRLKKIRKKTENYIYRELRYNFWVAYDALNMDSPNYEESNKFYLKFYESIIAYDAYYGYNKPLTQFLNAYSLHIVNIARKLQFNTIIDYLSIYDESNKPIYQKYYQD